MKTSQPTIVHVVPYYPPHIGGMERVAQTMAEALVTQGNAVCVLTSDHGLSAGTEHKGLLTVKRLRSFEFAHTPFALTLLYHLLRIPQVRLFHLHLSQAYWPELVLLASKIRRIPYVVHFHLDVGPSGFFGAVFLMYKKLLWPTLLCGARNVIVFSETQSQLIQKKYGVLEKNITIIPNAVGDESFIPHAEAVHPTLRLITVCRLSPQKKIDRLIDALSLVSVPAHLTIVGDGEERRALEKRVREKNLANVDFVGSKNQYHIQSLFKESDIFLISSDREGMPLTVLEAMAAGLPVIGSRVIGIEELITDSGILVDEPYPEGFAKAITSLSENKSRIQELSQKSKKVARNYSWSELIKKVESLYATLQ